MKKTFISAVLAACLGTALFSPVALADEQQEVAKLMRAGQLDQAGARADAFLQQRPRDAQMRFLKGLIQTEQGKSNEAISTFIKLTEDFPELPEPYNNLAVLYAAAGQYDKARAALEMAIRTHPSYATAHENLGDVYAKLASEAYNKALQLDGNNSGAQSKLSMARELIGGGKVRPSAPAPRTSVSPPPVAAAPTPATAVAKATPASVPAAPATKATPTPPPVAAATPPAPTPATPAPAAQSNASDEADVTKAVQSWARAWSSQDVNGYLGFYDKSFDPPGNTSRKAWEQERRARIEGKSSIQVSLSNIRVDVKGNTATAKFRQSYKGGATVANSAKTLQMVKQGNRWLIQKETTGG